VFPLKMLMQHMAASGMALCRLFAGRDTEPSGNDPPCPDADCGNAGQRAANIPRRGGLVSSRAVVLASTRMPVSIARIAPPRWLLSDLEVDGAVARDIRSSDSLRYP
jgi:hypothetical protein